MNKIVAIRVLSSVGAIVLLSGCGVTINTAQGRGSPTTSSTSAPSRQASSPSSSSHVGTTSSTGSSTSVVNNSGPSSATVQSVFNHTAAFNGSTGWISQKQVSVSDGQGGTLTAILAVWKHTADGGQEAIFVWHNQTFLGWTTAGMVTLPTLKAGHDRFLVTYYTWPASVPFAQYTPSTANSATTVSYWWTGSHLASSFNGAIPGEFGHLQWLGTGSLQS